MDQYIGKFLDNRYELLEVIGTGGMAVVYKARCHRLNRLVAVKILKTDLAQDAEFRRRFHDESQAVAMLSHPNIVAVYDVSHSDDLDYIVMELIDGITLKQYMQKKGVPLNWREALHFITQIVRALSHAHSRGIIHRDIKPHNIMVLRDGSVKVSDFGIARITSATQSTLTQEALGSVHYISPEQARGSHIDARSDIYSAGVVLYEMITGRLPFEGETPVAVAIQHINSIPLSPGELNPELPEALQEITMKAMAPNADERYLNADAMLADLEEFRKNPNINFDYTSEDLKPGDEPTRKVPPGGAIPGGSREESPTRTRTEQGRDRNSGGNNPQTRSGGKTGGKSVKKSQKPSRRDEDEYEDEGRGPIWPIFLALGAIIAFIVGIVWVLMSMFSTPAAPTGSFPVPDLRGMTVAEIKMDRTITEKFNIVEGETLPSEEYPAGTVMAQDPEPDTRVKGDKVTVTVTLSSGSDIMTIPSVENMEARSAWDLLHNKMGLNVEQQMETSEDITKGYAIRTDLPEGTVVQKGASVTLVISAGPEIKNVTVTRFVGQSMEKTMADLEELGLIIGETEQEPSDRYEEGQITWQSIPEGTEVPQGTIIDLRVSSGPDMSVIIPVVDMTAAEAEGMLRDQLGLVVTRSSEHSATVPEGIAIRTEPAAGSTVNRGSAVILYVSAGPEAVEPTPVVTTPPAVTDPPQVTPPPIANKTITVNLPTSAADKNVVQVCIEVDGAVKMNSAVETVMFPITPLIAGQGTQMVSIYIDGVLIQQNMETFS